MQQGSIWQRRQHFIKDIRRKNINSIMAETRSKLQANWHNKMANLGPDTLHNSFPFQATQLQKSILLLQLIAQQSNSTFTQQIQPNPNTVLLLKAGDMISLSHRNNTKIELMQYEIVECLHYLSRLICTKNQAANTKLRIINKLNNPESQSLAQIYDYTSQLIKTTRICNSLLGNIKQYLNNMYSASLNIRIVNAVTACLVELSCFRPRKFQNIQQNQLIESLNGLMKGLRDTLNLESCPLLQSVTQELSFKLINIKFTINSIYTFGNLFVNLSSYEAQGKDLFQQLHQLVFAVFAYIFKLLQHKEINQEHQMIIEIGEQFPQLASLMVWFIRNQILIANGLYRIVQNGNITENISADQKWMVTIYSILNQFSRTSNPASQMLQKNLQTTSQIISTVKLLNNDFGLPLEHLFNILQFVYSIPMLNRPHTSTLVQNIHWLYLQLFNRKYIDHSQFQLSLKIIQQTLRIIQQSHLTINSLTLCRTIISTPQYSQHQYKMKVFQQLCNNFESMMQTINKKEDEETTFQYIKLFHSILQLSQMVQLKNQMESQLMSYDTLKGLLHLCDKLWLSDKNNEHIISTLYLLKSISDNPKLSSHLTSVLLNEGHKQSLQNLSEHPNQQINQLVYQIFELLQLQ